MKEGPPGDTLVVFTESEHQGGPLTCCTLGLDLSRKKLDVCLLSDQGEQLDQLAVPPDVDSLRALARRIDELHAEPVCAVVESMTGARIVHDRSAAGLGRGDRRRAEGQGPGSVGLQADKIDSLVLAVLSQRDLVPAIWLPDPHIRESASWPRFRLHLVKHRSMLKHRIHSTLINFGEPCTVSDLFGVAGRRLFEGSRCPRRGART